MRPALQTARVSTYRSQVNRGVNPTVAATAREAALLGCTL